MHCLIDGGGRGVLIGVDDGEVLVPVSWKEMRGVRSGVLEKRKVAKPV